MKPRYEIGDVAYRVDVHCDTGPRVQCPDCNGEKSWHVTLPSGEEFDIDCQACKVGFDGPYGTVPGERRYVVSVLEVPITRVELEERDGRKWFRYNYCDEDKLFDTKEAARATGDAEVAERKAYFAEQEAKQRSSKMREINRPYGKIDREDLRRALQVIPYEIGQAIYHELTGGKLPRKKRG